MIYKIKSKHDTGYETITIQANTLADALRAWDCNTPAPESTIVNIKIKE
jgi:hypothetical protein